MRKPSNFRWAAKSDLLLLGCIVRIIVAIPLLFLGFVYAYAHQVQVEEYKSSGAFAAAFRAYGLVGTGTWLLVKPKGFGAGFLLLTFSVLPLTVWLCWLLGFSLSLGYWLFPLIMLVDVLSMRFVSAHIVLLVRSRLVTIKNDNEDDLTVILHWGKTKIRDVINTIKKDYEKTINRWKSDV